MTLRRLSIVSLLAACTSSPSSPDEVLPDCPSGNCGKTSFRRAVPTREKVRIARPTGRARHSLPLDGVSSALVAIDERVVMIDRMVDEVFGEIDAVSSTEAVTATDREHLWRAPDPELPGRDDVLRIKTVDEVSFQIEYFIVAKGVEPGGTPVIRGSVRLAEESAISDLDLTVDLSGYTALDPAYDTQGEVVLSVSPYARGVAEHRFDFRNFSQGDGPVANTLTTAWELDDDSGALEYLGDVDGEPTQAYARWDARGGRYDHHLQYDDPDVGLVDEIMTNCWAPTGREAFVGWAVIDQFTNYYGELDGDEAACVFGPVADHPDPGQDFDDLPAEGTWELLELLSWCEVSSAC